LRTLPGWIAEESGDSGPHLLAGLAGALALLLEVLLWPVLGLALLLPPVMIVEECGLLSALGRWANLVRRRLGRVVLYEALAASLGVVATLPFLVPIAIAGIFSAMEGSLDWVRWLTLSLLAGPALSPLFAFLTVANVYIYINLQYEFSSARA
jgi:hypothetical protein